MKAFCQDITHPLPQGEKKWILVSNVFQQNSCYNLLSSSLDCRIWHSFCSFFLQSNIFPTIFRLSLDDMVCVQQKYNEKRMEIKWKWTCTLPVTVIRWYKGLNENNGKYGNLSKYLQYVNWLCPLFRFLLFGSCFPAYNILIFCFLKS